MADLIADVVETGSTLKAAGLEVFGEPLMHSEAVLVTRDEFRDDPRLATLDRRLEAGVPAELLRRRPDLVAAEATISAELARLDARQAARQPDFALSGTLGWKALTLAALGGSGALVATLAASVDWPVHDGGLLAAQVEAQQAVLEQARLSWRAATLTAAQDAEDSLAAAAGSRAQATVRAVRAVCGVVCCS